MSDFYKYHGLGNDYLVVDPAKFNLEVTAESVRLICDRNRGVGSDGILYGPLIDEDGSISVRIYNPDGSEAEKSGNGLRIFSRYLHEAGYVSSQDFEINTQGGRVSVHLDSPDARLMTVSMGRLTFRSREIPVRGPEREVLEEPLEVNGRKLEISAASIGNPHCVVLCDRVDRNLAHQLGPLLERHPLFPRRTNVQFMEILDRRNIKIEIWERGAGYTLASGSSSCAAAGVAYRLGRCDPEIQVHMPGGTLHVFLSPDFSVRMRGEVSAVFEGRFADEIRTRLVPGQGDRLH
ncbi:MAG: diaminopimelate epimerase [Deltaproteobacteria bacterium]|nr:diaminopimelate epimerase [Deltaproteobacteria bacterium]MBW2120305.1 diaminopimelate epimerase [Deltaproteobacteria bacterium]